MSEPDEAARCVRCADLLRSYGPRFPEGSVVRCHEHRPTDRPDLPPQDYYGGAQPASWRG